MHRLSLNKASVVTYIHGNCLLIFRDDIKVAIAESESTSHVQPPAWVFRRLYACTPETCLLPFVCGCFKLSEFSFI